MAPPVFRFAPSPNGLLHTGHAYSALLNAQLARDCDGTLLVRLENIDEARCTRAFADAALEDLRWLGLAFPEPVRRQSEHRDAYLAAQATLAGRDLLYPCFCTRGDIAHAVAGRPDWPRDPDGAPLYPGTCRGLSAAERLRRCQSQPHGWRLDTRRAIAAAGDLTWSEWSEGGTTERPACPTDWGDPILVRKDIGTSYHVAVVVDDAIQGITHVVRGKDLLAATSIHRLLQTLLRLPAPGYRHHPLVRDAVGEKLAKSRGSRPLRALRQEGASPEDVRRLLGFA